MTYRSYCTRREVLCQMGAAGMLTLSSSVPLAAHTGMIEQLSLFGPPAGPSIALAHAVATGRFSAVTDESRFEAWRTPDQLRAGLTSGEIELSVVPIQAAANLYNRGFPIRLANVMTDGLLYVLTDAPNVAALPDLAGLHVAVPFRGDTPELIFARLLAHHGLVPGRDVTLTYSGTPIEAMQLLLAGRVDAALTAEPATTMGVLRGQQAGKGLRRAIDLQQAWGEMTGASPVVPQAGLAVTETFLKQNGAIMPDILSALKLATDDVLADPLAAAGHAATTLRLPAALLAASVPHCNLVARGAATARADIERMLSAIAGEELQAIGGALPGDDFYL